MKNWLLSLCFLLAINSMWAQNLLPIGSWRSHLPQRIGEYVTQSETQLFYATSLSLVIMDKNELAPKYVTTVQGLSEVGIRLVRYHAPTETLIIVYENSVIDLYKEGQITTVNAIKNFTNITGEKTVNDIFIYDDRTVYLAGSYGVSSFRLDNGTLPFSTFTGGANVRSVAVHEGFIYAGTVEGIYRTEVNNINPNDFSNWVLLGPESGFPADYSANAMCLYEGQLYIGINEDIYRLENGLPVLFSDQDEQFDLQYMTAEGQYLLAGYRCGSGDCGANGQVLYLDALGNVGELPAGCLGVTNTAIEDQNGRIWFGDEWRNFRYLNSVQDEACSTLSFDSPYSELVWELDVVNDEVWYAAGALTANRSPRFIDHGFSALINGDWITYNRWTNDIMKGVNPDPNVRGDDVFAVINIAVNPVTNSIFAGSFLEGLVEVQRSEEGETLTLHNKENSPLQGAIGDEGRTRIGGLAVDEDGNVWVSNQNALEGKPLHRIAPDGSWTSFNRSCSQDDLFQIAIDQNNYKWIIIGNGTSGILLFNEGDIEDTSDDECRVFSAANSNLPTNETNCLAVDLDGDVWVGTNAGIIIFECGGSAFDNSCRGSLRVVERDGFNEYLFKTQTVQAIAVDGANRKWIGTSNGAYLISSDGEEELLHFTADNSPLFDNNIRDIAINNRTGEVFFGTDRGLVSYQGDAVVGARLNSKDVEVFPNPVRPEYDGPIAIRGLARDANVKITDVSGKLVYETQAQGGQAIWDGRDYNGRRAQTGVYLIFSTTNPRVAGLSAQPDAVVGKVLFVN